MKCLRTILKPCPLAVNFKSINYGLTSPESTWMPRSTDWRAGLQTWGLAIQLTSDGMRTTVDKRGKKGHKVKLIATSPGMWLSRRHWFARQGGGRTSNVWQRGDQGNIWPMLFKVFRNFFLLICSMRIHGERAVVGKKSEGKGAAALYPCTKLVCRSRGWQGHIWSLKNWPEGMWAAGYVSVYRINEWTGSYNHQSYAQHQYKLRRVTSFKRKTSNKKTFLFLRNTSRRGLFLNRCPHWVLLFTQMSLAWNRKFRNCQRQSQPWVRAHER